MTGTSIDGIDASLVQIDGVGLHMQARLLHHHSRPLGDIGPVLRAAAEQMPMTAGDFAKLAWQFGELHAAVIAELLHEAQMIKPPLPLGEGRGEGPPVSGKSHDSPTVDLICVHGQTVFHQPPVSWQLVNTAPIAQRFGCAVVTDLRQADLAAGGQGAPITPIADWILFRAIGKRCAIVNLGGFCNVTVLPANGNAEDEWRAIRGFDVCACNQILDVVAREALGRPFDEHGNAACRGRIDPRAAGALRESLERQRIGGRSLGTGDEAARWVHEQIKNGVGPSDIAATAVDAIARCIADALREHQPDAIILAGGGARNCALKESIAIASNSIVHLSDEFGVPIEARESMEFAVLGALCADGVAITLPQVTGCREPAPVAGVWTGLIQRDSGGLTSARAM